MKIVVATISRTNLEKIIPGQCTPLTLIIKSGRNELGSKYVGEFISPCDTNYKPPARDRAPSSAMITKDRAKAANFENDVPMFLELHLKGGRDIVRGIFTPKSPSEFSNGGISIRDHENTKEDVDLNKLGELIQKELKIPKEPMEPNSETSPKKRAPNKKKVQVKTM